MENKVIFIILAIILVITLVFNIVLLSRRVAKTDMYEHDLLVILGYETHDHYLGYTSSYYDEHKIRNRGVFKDLIDFEKDMYLSCLIILLVPLILSILLLLAEFIAGLKNSLQGMVFKIFNIINLIFCAVFAIIYFVLFCIYCCINGTDKTIRKHYRVSGKEVKNRSLTHIFLDLILFIALAVAAVLSFLAMKNGTSSSGSSSSSSARKETNQTKENQPIKKQDNADASERPNNLLTKDAK
jgi:heme/copper-type cytochrome/quinol oxidase subunit 2